MASVTPLKSKLSRYWPSFPSNSPERERDRAAGRAIFRMKVAGRVLCLVDLRENGMEGNTKRALGQIELYHRKLAVLYMCACVLCVWGSLLCCKSHNMAFERELCFLLCIPLGFSLCFSLCDCGIWKVGVCTFPTWFSKSSVIMSSGVWKAGSCSHVVWKV